LEALKSSDDRFKNAAIIGLGRIGKPETAWESLKIKFPESFHATEWGTEGPHATPNSEIIPPHLAVRALVRMGVAEQLIEAVVQSHNPLALWAVRYVHDPVVPQRLIELYESTDDASFREDILQLLARIYYQVASYDS